MSGPSTIFRIVLLVLLSFFIGASFVAQMKKGWRQEAEEAQRPTPLHASNPKLMVVSWYGPGFAGKQTASGSYFDPSGMTAASRSLPFGTRLLVGLRGKWVEVTVTDRGPVPLDRDLDLSEGAAKALGFTRRGLAAVHVIQLEDQP